MIDSEWADGTLGPHTLAEGRAELDAVIYDLQTLAEPDRAALLMRAEDQMTCEEMFQDGDKDMVLADLGAYIEAQDKVDASFQNREEWITKAIRNVARAGKFSSDPTIQKYASEIWHAEPIEIAPFSGGSHDAGR